MKKFIITLTALLAMTVQVNAMSYEQAREQALFLTDKMAYELNLTEDQYEAAYEINLDYLMSVESQADLYGVYWTRRNLDLSYILLDWQYSAYCAAAYFYRPLYWEAGFWHFGIYARYPYRSYFFFGRPHFYLSYRGGHAWHRNGGRSWYHGRSYGMAHRHGHDGRGFGMRNGYDRGDYRNHSIGSRGNMGRDRGSFGRDRGNMGRDRGSIGRDRGSMSRDRGSIGNSRSISRDRGTIGNSRSISRDRGSIGSNRGTMDRDRGSIGSNRSSTRTTVGGNRSSFGGSRSNFSRESSTPSRTFSPSRSSGSRSSSIGSSSRSSSFGGGSRGGFSGGSRGGSFSGGSRGGGSHGGGFGGGRGGGSHGGGHGGGRH